MSCLSTQQDAARRWKPVPNQENDDMKFNAGRRGALFSLGVGLIASGLPQDGSVNAAMEETLTPANAKELRELSRVLAGIPRWRDFWIDR